MKNFLKTLLTILQTILELIILVGAVGLTTLGIDYLRVTNGEVPIFNINKFDKKTNIETYQGILYNGRRKIRGDKSEPLRDSVDVKFVILSKFDVKLPKFSSSNVFSFKIETTEVENCTEQSKLYYATLNKKVYTYCLSSIVVDDYSNKVEMSKYLIKKKDLLDDFIDNIGFKGQNPNNDIYLYESFDDGFTNNGLRVYECHNTFNDIYIGPKNMEFQPDFCSNKNDDFKFVSKIVEELPEGYSNPKNEYELLFEDENNRYEIEKGKIDYIYLVSEEHRGLDQTRYSLREVVNNNIMTIDELKDKGLKINIVKK